MELDYAPYNNNMEHQQIPPAVMEFVGRYKVLEAYRSKEQDLIKDLLIYAEHMERELRDEKKTLEMRLNDAYLDLEDAKKSRRDMQQQVLLHKARLAEYDRWKEQHAYVLVLVDGDGMIFNPDLIRQGIEGGKQAAAALRANILELCHLPPDIEIVANVYANQHGLANALLRDGSADDLEQLRNFTIGFTQGKASFDFIDVGHGKERADSKIKELTRWHLKNLNCSQILLGISHDAGYAPFLEEVVKAEDRSRVCIMEGTPVVKELSTTGLQIINFNQIFHPEKLSDQRPPINTQQPQSSTWAGVTSVATSPPAPPPVPVIKNVVKKQPTPTSTPKPKPKWHPEPRGFDPQINVNQAVLDRIKRRTNSNKLCNNHYLRGPCAKGDDCCFEHNYKVSEDEKLAIAYLTRLNPCVNGQDCDQEFCIYGHHCPSVSYIKNEPVCSAFGCRFGPDDHPPGTQIRHPRKERYERSDYSY